MNDQNQIPDTQTLYAAHLSAWQLFSQNRWPLLLLSFIALATQALFSRLFSSSEFAQSLVTIALGLTFLPLVYAVAMQILFASLDGRSQPLAESRLSISQSWKALNGRRGSVLRLHLRGFFLALGLMLLSVVGAIVLAAIFTGGAASMAGATATIFILLLCIGSVLGVGIVLQTGAVIPVAVEGYQGTAALQRRRELYKNSRALLWSTGLKISGIVLFLPLIAGLIVGLFVGINILSLLQLPFILLAFGLYSLLSLPLTWCIIAKTHVQMANKLDKLSAAENPLSTEDAADPEPLSDREIQPPTQ